MPRLRRSHTCGELRETHVGETVLLNGWVHVIRAFPQQIFIDLRDRYGLTQVVVEADRAAGAAASALFKAAGEVGREWVLAVRGKVRHRLPGKDNPDLDTGKVELQATELHVLNRCPTPPFEVTEFPGDELAGEDLRMQYRYLDLRRGTLHHTLIMRHRMNKIIRDYLDERGFLELETPLLGRSTPEGARDYLVPSRVFPGQWFALPQSPQLYKQLLMVAGYDKYFQIARCLRDEDLRADRQPEFTQLDLEMSFVEMDDVLSVIEGLTAEVFKRCIGATIPLPLPRIKYADAMLKYGSDKPDLRFGLEIVDLTEFHRESSHEQTRQFVERGAVIRGLVAKGAADKFSRKKLDEIKDYCKRLAQGEHLEVWIDAAKVQSDVFGSLFEKFLTAETRQAQRQRLGAEPGDFFLIIGTSKEEVTAQAMGMARNRLAADLKLVNPTTKDFKIVWITDFPSFIWDEDEKRFAANHHPFTAPMDEDLANLESAPGTVRAKAYDLVINGYECGGGSIRIHSPEVQSLMFKMLGMSPEQARQRFGFLLDALKFGAPPHGGIALGLDRFAMMLADTTNIRDVIAFPKNQKARDLMTGAPAPVDAKQLKELGL